VPLGDLHQLLRRLLDIRDTVERFSS
jgi:hypothetical protein